MEALKIISMQLHQMSPETVPDDPDNLLRDFDIVLTHDGYRPSIEEKIESDAWRCKNRLTIINTKDERIATRLADFINFKFPKRREVIPKLLKTKRIDYYSFACISQEPLEIWTIIFQAFQEEGEGLFVPRSHFINKTTP